MSALNIAFIGCGRISSKHFDALDRLQDQIKIQALCDSNIERAHHARSRNCGRNATVYGDIATMLTQENGLNVAVIALPNGLHAQAGLQAAQAGLHIIMEKPLSVYLADGQKLVASCRSYNVKLFLIHQNRFNPPIQNLYKAIAGGRLGRIYNIYANIFWTRPQSYYDGEANWHGNKEMDGGAFYTQASHYVDMVQWFAGGRPRYLCGQLRTLARSIETEDCGMAILEWGQPGQPDNLIATINMSMLTYPRNLEGSVLVLGEQGTIKIGGTAMNQVDIWQLEGMEQNTENMFGSYDTDSVYGLGHHSLYAAIAAKLRGETQEPSIKAALISGENILDNLIILEGIRRSSRNGGQVIEL